MRWSRGALLFGFLSLMLFPDGVWGQHAVSTRPTSSVLHRSSFLENAGQWREGLKYVAFVDGVEWQVERDRIVLMRHREVSDGRSEGSRTLLHQDRRSPRLVQTYTLVLSFVGATSDVAISGERSESMATFLKRTPSGVEAHEARRFERLRWKGVYPGIDALLFEEQGTMRLEWDVCAGANLDQIQVHIDGMDRLELEGDAVTASFNGGRLKSESIRAFAGENRIPCAYALLDDHTFGFACAARAANQALYVDPGLSWASYFGSIGNDTITAIAAIDEQQLALAGYTYSPSFPTTLGAWSATRIAYYDCFVAVLDPSRQGSASLIASTYLGGSEDEYAAEILVLSNGSLTVSGKTTSPNFPVTAGCLQPNFRGGSNPFFGTDLFITVMDLRLQGAAQLVYGTYLGGTGDERVDGACLLSGNRIALCGTTDSIDFPVSANALSSQFLGRSKDGFAVVVDPQAVGPAQLSYSSYLGGRFLDACGDICSHGANLVIVGETGSDNLPTTPGAAFPWPSGNGDAFVIELDLSLSGAAQVRYCTYLGASGNDYALGVGIGPDDRIYVCGNTDYQFPTTSTALTRQRVVGSISGFLSILDPRRVGLQQLTYSTYLNGASDDLCKGLSVDRTGIVDLFFQTISRDFYATPGAMQTRSASPGYEDLFVLRLDPSRSGVAGLIYGSFLGGDDYDFGDTARRLDSWFCVFAGATYSQNFPTTSGAWSSQYLGSLDGFLAILDMLPAGVRAYGRSTPGCHGPSALTVRTMPQIGNPNFEIWAVATPPSAIGLLLLGDRALLPPVDLFGTELFVNPGRHAFTAVTLQSEARGVSIAGFAIPNQGWMIGQSLYAQTLWFESPGSSPCPPRGLSASHALEITLQQ